ncbi:MAG TPA: hypothetical protein VNV16_12485 [Methylibium sp.]|nr:hypothetical protein [Methylibium sp.]
MKPTYVYTPKPDSLPGRVCAYFLKNPDEELNAGDMVLKFDAPRASISSLLAASIGAGLVRRVPGHAVPTFAAGEHLERLRTAEGFAAPAAAAAVPTPSGPTSVFAAGDAAKRPRRKRQLLPPFDPHAIPIKTGVPIPAPRNHREASAKSSYQQLLERIPPGGMVEIDTPRAKSLMSCAKKLGIKGLTTRLLDDAGLVTGVWRNAA